ncbi:MAG: AAA family ATPase [Promethearchaeota archaeon]
MEKKCVVGFVGLPGSGKSTALEAVKDLGTIVIMGDVVREECKKRGLEINSKNMGEVSKMLRKEFGSTIIAQKCVENIRSKKDKIIFVDGLRSMDEVKIFRKYWDFPIIAIICDKEVRYKRMTLRGRADDTDNLKKLIERDERELSFGVGDVIANADYKINNDSDIESLMKNTRDIVLKILDKKNS